MLNNCNCDCIISENDGLNKVLLELYIGSVDNPILRVCNCHGDDIDYTDFVYTDGKIYYDVVFGDLYGGVYRFQVVGDNGFTTDLIEIDAMNIGTDSNAMMTIDEYGYILTDVSTHPVELPIATDTTLGGVKVGDGLAIDNTGILSVDESQLGSLVNQIYVGSNNDEVFIAGYGNELVKVQFGALAVCTPLFTTTIQLNITYAGTVDFELVYDHVNICTFSQVVTLGSNIVTISRPLLGTGAGGHGVSIRMISTDAAGSVAEQGAFATVSGYNLEESNAWDGTITILAPVDKLMVNMPADVVLKSRIATIYIENDIDSPINGIGEQHQALIVNMPANIVLGNITESVSTEEVTE